MNASVAIGAAYLAQLWVKASLAGLHRAKEGVPSQATFELLTIIQPVTSGDETLGGTLRATLDELYDAHLIWVVDRADSAAQDLCRSLSDGYPGRGIQIVKTDEPPAGINPKLWKQDTALPFVQTALLAVVDDDTRVSRKSMALLLEKLAAGADIATGLPCYVPAQGRWSHLVAEFVNSAAILTYLPAAACAAPRSINGMCYALRTEYARKNRLFSVTARAITDDLSIAREIRRLGGRIVQTTQPQFISTSVVSIVHYRRLMHRWFVFTRILVQSETRCAKAALLLAYGLHPILLGALFVLAIVSPMTAVWPLAFVLVLRSATLGALNLKFTGSWRHSPLSSIVIELSQPAFLAAAFAYPFIWWRKRRIRVRRFDDFQYLAP
jgi:ceramide glucosyltransferase